jgi:hypothetical protein
MKTQFYAVTDPQLGVVYGVGTTIELARADALNWHGQTINDNDRRSVTACLVIECTEAAYQRVMDRGGAPGIVRVGWDLVCTFEEE